MTRWWRRDLLRAIGGDRVTVPTKWTEREALSEEVAVVGHVPEAKPDRRRAQRAGKLAQMIAAKPSSSFPEIFTESADLESFYRFVNSDRFTWRDVLAPHAECTVRRAAHFDCILMAHDTSDLSMALYEPDALREFFAPLSSRTQGMLFHAGLAIGFGPEQPVPLGLLNLQPYVHQHPDRPKDFQAFWEGQGGWYPHEMARWFEGVSRSDERLQASGARVIHVMDREADSYGLLSFLVGNDHRFVVRCVEHNRRDGETGLPLSKVLENVPFVAQRTVRLGARSPLRGKRELAKHPARKERTAELHFRAKKVVIKRPQSRDSCYVETSWDELPETIELNVVQALELSPPEGEAPVQWLLLTTEPIDTPEDIVRIVDYYRARWLIEEFFKALKTGCALEKRQVESAEAMLKTLALLAPIAWQLLLIRHLANADPELPWRMVLPEEAFRLLQAEVGERRLPNDASVRDVMYQIAAIGGHRKNNGPPGWQTLGRGMEKLLTWMEGAALARRMASLINP
jgi:hypothetical protein